MGLYTKETKEEKIIKIIYGLLLSLLFHLLIFSSFTDRLKALAQPLQAKEKKITLNLQAVLPPRPKPVAKSKSIVKKAKNQKPVKQTPVIKTPKIKAQKVKKTTIIEKTVKKKKIMPKESHTKAISSKKLKENNSSKYQAKKIQKTIKKVIKPKPKKKEIQKLEIIKIEEPLEAKDESLSGMLLGFGTAMYAEELLTPLSPQRKSEEKIHTLYGSEFDTYSHIQQKYIQHNLERIQQITQNTSDRNGYPETARQTKQAGTNIVSFYLHPNGDISDLKLKHHIGSASLDKNTLEVIKIAYKDYPLPNEKTRLIFYVEYSLY